MQSQERENQVNSSARGYKKKPSESVKQVKKEDQLQTEHISVNGDHSKTAEGIEQMEHELDEEITWIMQILSDDESNPVEQKTAHVAEPTDVPAIHPIETRDEVVSEADDAEIESSDLLRQFYSSYIRPIRKVEPAADPITTDVR
ncbi:uncharacterized protein LOC123475533 isoform X1 [Daphnia magna]|uniref:uncharacterized protein LOC123475533 isoform X1 n=1 Tax=Daphnia magna TaxID=35525 RepID=UPI001E1BB789|nr:uncharacterized protein LOC123475533 isoform X1 [Daphnia magna]